MVRDCNKVKDLNNGVRSRLAAFDLLDAVNRDGAYANLAMPKILAESGLSTKDKGFATELAYSTIRLQARYDFVIGEFSDRAVSEIDPKLIDLLRLGAHQIFGMRTPQHAAINETVEVAKKVAGKSRASFLNALLRKFTNVVDLDELIDSKVSNREENYAIKYSHPIWIIRAFYDQLGDWDQVKALLIANNEPAKPNLIAWPSLSTKEELLSVGGIDIPLVDNGVVATKPPEEYLAIKERRAGVQDFGSQYLTEIFYSTISSNSESWLDLCAAPGGKAKYLYELLGHKNFFANESNSSRFGLLKQVLPEKALFNLDGRESSAFNRKFDRILIDAPCTGLGALRRRPEARWRKSVADLKELIKIQKELIDGAVSMLNPGGIIGYATCSPHSLETKVQVADALLRHKNFEVMDISTLNPRFTTGVQKDGTMQLWTHRDGCDSMYLALLRMKP